MIDKPLYRGYADLSRLLFSQPTAEAKQINMVLAVGKRLTSWPCTADMAGTGNRADMLDGEHGAQPSTMPVTCQ